MSGGRFNYTNDSLARDVLGWQVRPNYNLTREDCEDDRELIRRSNPLGDVVVSELVYDVFCLLHSYDWYASGDTGADTYLADINYFKRKWLRNGELKQAHIRRLIDSRLDALRIELYQGLTSQPPDPNTPAEKILGPIRE